jgi:prepilin-type N-terminal cleavage/methylation domain-containing protein
MKRQSLKIHNSGFTLVELMLVIAIIGVLSSIVLSELGQTRALARDARRKIELRGFVAGLELYYSKYGVYPCGDDYDGAGQMLDSSLSYPFLEGDSKINPWERIGDMVCPDPDKGLYSEGIIASPSLGDPINQVYKYFYSYELPYDRQSYVLYARLERGSVASANDRGVCSNFYEVGPYVGKLSHYSIVDGGWYGVACN